MAKIEIYTTMFCPYCFAAKKLLNTKGVEFTEIDVDMTPGARQQMRERSGGQRTVPQIFVDDAHLGDCDKLHQLDETGELDDRLAGNRAQ